MNNAAGRPLVHLLELHNKRAALIVDDAVGLASVLDAAPLSSQAALADPLPQALFFDANHMQSVPRKHETTKGV